MVKRDWQSRVWKHKAKIRAYNPNLAIERARKFSLNRAERKNWGATMFGRHLDGAFYKLQRKIGPTVMAYALKVQ